MSYKILVALTTIAVLYLSFAVSAMETPTPHKTSIDVTDVAQRPPPSIWFLDCVPASQAQCQEAAWRCGPTENKLYPGKYNPSNCQNCGCRIVGWATSRWEHHCDGVEDSKKVKSDGNLGSILDIFGWARISRKVELNFVVGISLLYHQIKKLQTAIK